MWIGTLHHMHVSVNPSLSSLRQCVLRTAVVYRFAFCFDAFNVRIKLWHAYKSALSLTLHLNFFVHTSASISQLLLKLTPSLKKNVSHDLKKESRRSKDIVGNVIGRVTTWGNCFSSYAWAALVSLGKWIFRCWERGGGACRGGGGGAPERLYRRAVESRVKPNGDK